MADGRYTIRMGLKRWWRRRAGALSVVFSVLAVVLVAVAVVQFVMLHNQGWRVVPGTVPDWFSAVGASATVGALVVAWRVYRHDVASRREDRERQDLAERRRQAENITAWLGGQTAVKKEVVQGQGPVLTTTVRVNISNASPSVIYDVIVVTTNQHSGRPGLFNDFSAPPQALDVRGNALLDVRGTGTASNSQMTESIRFEKFEWNPRQDRLARGRAQVVPAGSWRMSLKLAHPAVVAEDLHLFFRDQRGVYWWRDANGQLTELPAPPNRDRDGRKQQIEDALGEGPSDSGLGILAPKRLRDEDAT